MMCAVVTAAIFWAAPAVAGQDQPPAEAAAAGEGIMPSGMDPDAIRCRRSAPTGSRVPGKPICMSNREWAARAQAGNREAREMFQNMTPLYTR
ncbi:MAG: hypothetical protein ACK4TG_02445 [Thermaurantiacus sp.]